MINHLVSILLSVYNDEKYIYDSIRSLLKQTYSNIEIILIDDASTDRTKEIYESISDPKIRVYRNDKNIGLTKSLNKAIQYVNGKYIARQDSDDISKPDRIATQVEYMEANPSTKILGSNYILIDEKGNYINKSKKLPLKYNQIKFYSLFDNPFIHSSIMIKSSLIENKNILYNNNYKTSQDFELWSRLINDYKCENLPEKLIYYRLNKDSISSRYNEASIDLIKMIIKNTILKRNVIGINEEFIDYWVKLRFGHGRLKFYEFLTVINTFHYMFKQFSNEIIEKNGLYKIKLDFQLIALKHYIKLFI